MRYMTSILVLWLCAGCVANLGRIEERGDTVSLRNMRVLAGAFDHGRRERHEFWTVGLDCVIAGRGAARPSSVLLRFVYRGQDWRYARNRTAVFSFDDRTVTVELARKRIVARGFVIELLTGRIGLDDFVALARSPGVTVTLCGLDAFRLSGKRLGRLERLLRAAGM